MHKIIILSGPTACGKTRVINELRELYSELICINMDSRQIFQHLPIITAMPQHLSPQDYLFNFAQFDEDINVAQWLDMAFKIITSHKIHIPIIIVGGTGLYSYCLRQGINIIPEISQPVKEEIQSRFETLGRDQFYKELILQDVAVAKRISSRDSHRVIRAAQVMMQTGRSIFEHEEKVNPFSSMKIYEIIIMPPNRNILYDSIDRRFEIMLDRGVIQEVQHALDIGMNQTHRAYKCCGIPQIHSYIQGQISKDEMRQQCKMLTRRYAKRQCTWFNNKPKSAIIVQTPQQACSILKSILCE